MTDPRLSPNLERNDMILNNNSAKTNSKRLNSEKWQNKFTSHTGGEFMRVKLLISQFLIYDDDIYEDTGSLDNL